MKLRSMLCGTGRLLLLGCCAVAQLQAEENWWPVFTSREADAAGRPENLTAAAPFYERKSIATPEQTVISLRPLYTAFDNAAAGELDRHWLYPLFSRHESDERSAWSMLNLVRGGHYHTTGTRYIEFWPFYLSRDTGREADSYNAYFPFYGTIKDRLWKDRIDFVLFPFYGRTEIGDEVRLHTPYPFFQTRHGPYSRGWGIWPLYGSFAREDDYRHRYILWPIHYHYVDDLAEPQPRERFGLLPFYSSETAEGLRSETWIWPFFGYLKQTAPNPEYREIRYLWPLIVQGRGEELYRNRVLPLYAYETRPGYEKSWVLWPLFRTQTWDLGGQTTKERSTLLYFLFFNEVQTGPGLRANKSWLWPIFGLWDNGAGRSQFQLFDPLSVFFKNNAAVRENWTPLFALYRYDARGESRRHSLLWNLMVLEHGEAEKSGFYLGPLFERTRNGPEHGWEVLKGLAGARREADGALTLKLLWMEL